MPNVVKNQIPTAEIDGGKPVNPFGAPVATEAPTEIFGDIGRATKAEIARTNSNMVATDIAFVAMYSALIASLVTNVNPGVTSTIFAIAAMVAWFCFGRMVLSCNKLNASSMMIILAFAVPILGFFIFLAAKKQASRFLIWNGHRPGFLGAEPAPSEIRLMNSDPNYRPVAMFYFYRDGSKRRIPWSLSDWFIALATALGIGAIVTVVASFY
jgi:hypothetical protein